MTMSMPLSRRRRRPTQDPLLQKNTIIWLPSNHIPERQRENKKSQSVRIKNCRYTAPTDRHASGIIITQFREAFTSEFLG